MRPTVGSGNIVVNDYFRRYDGRMDMPTPYRRGNLREALLDRAHVVLAERGEAALSLRELARDVGVSHAAPARHFADRHDLVDAVAIQGLEFLHEQLRAAEAATVPAADRVAAVAHAYVGFALAKAHLIDVMFHHREGRDAAAIGAAAGTAFAPIGTLFPDEGGGPAPAAFGFLAALQGIVALVSCGVIAADDVATIVDDTVRRYAPSAADATEASA
jgi:AcrR family transcriptional regulator